ncbi:MAG: hypothetical protein LBG74_02060 [Spirochaetaceae bacterium]|nr:hypothetical protein [Spirochaetaceae bacterium]
MPIYAAEEFTDGRIKLVLDDRLGKFSLYYMTDVEKKVYEPLFWDKDKRTSYLSLFIDGRVYVLGESASFKTTIRGSETKPALVFESKDVSITEEFSFIRTASSGVTNGIRIDYKIENWSARAENAGLSLLLDTFLGEKATPHFRTDLRPIENETTIDRTTSDQWWVSRNSRYGLMGSIFVTGLESPDFVFFGNWKRMNETRWKPEYVQGRNFNSLPFSVKDSAVAYYMDVGRVERWQKRQMTVLLAAEDIYGFEYNKTTPSPLVVQKEIREAPIIIVPETPPAPLPPGGQRLQNQNIALGTGGRIAGPPGNILLPIGPIRVDIQTLNELIAKVDEYIYFNRHVTEEELRGMESVLQKIKLRHGASF